MTKEKKKFLKDLKKRFLQEVDKKFPKGDKEHKNDLFDIDLITELEGEVIDTWVYLQALKRK